MLDKLLSKELQVQKQVCCCTEVKLICNILYIYGIKPAV